MRKFFALVMTMSLLMLTSLSVGAIAPSAVADLARYFPADAPFFAAIRTDADFVTELDTVLASLDSVMPAELLPEGMNLSQALEMLAKGMNPDSTFDETFRTWLGGTIAVGAVNSSFLNPEMSASQDEAVIIAFAITDAAAARTFIESTMASGYATEELLDGGVLIHPQQANRYQQTFYIGDDVVLVRNSALDAMSLVPSGDTLAANSEFTAALDRLPASDYNAVLYFDPMVLAEVPDLQVAQTQLEDNPLGLNLLGALEALGAQSAGATILNGDSLVIDFAAHVADPVALAAAGFDLGGHAPLNLEFARNVIGDTPLMIQGTGLGSRFLALFNQMTELGNYYESQAQSRSLSSDEEGLVFLDDAVTFITQAVNGLSGLDLVTELGKMDGNYLLTLDTFGSDIPDVPFIPRSGMVFEFPDAESAANHVAGVSKMLYELGITVDTSMDGVSIVTVLGEALGEDNLDLFWAANGNQVIFGTRPAYFDLIEDSNSILDNTVYQTAAQTFLADSQFLAFANIEVLRPLIEQLAEMDNDFYGFNLLAPLFNSGSISASYDDAGNGVVRFVLTLNNQ